MQATFLAGATLAKHTDLNAAISAGKPVGILTLPVVTIEDGLISVTPHVGIFPSGVFMREDKTTDVAAPVPGPTAAEYTLVQLLDPGLHKQPELAVISGVYIQEQVQDYIVLGWIYHPGASLAMSTNMFVSAPRAGAKPSIAEFTADDLYAKLQAAYGSSAAVTITRTRDGRVTIHSNAATQQSLVIPLLVPVSDDLVQSLLVDMSLSSQSWLSLARVTCESGVVTATAIPYAGVSGLLAQARLLLPLARQVQSTWSVFALELTFTLGPGADVSLARVAATTLAAASVTRL